MWLSRLASSLFEGRVRGKAWHVCHLGVMLARVGLVVVLCSCQATTHDYTPMFDVPHEKTHCGIRHGVGPQVA